MQLDYIVVKEVLRMKTKTGVRAGGIRYDG